MSDAFDPRKYGPAVAELLSEERIPPLGPGSPNMTVRGKLAALTPESIVAGRISNRSMADACRSALWLYHDFLDESHTISQGIETTTGSYWHGIMHRREPDFGNSKYWFRRVGEHPIFADLAAGAARLAAETEGLKAATWLRDIRVWDPFRFIDLCSAVYRQSGPDHDLCRRVSLLEWQLLFDYSYRNI